MNENELYHYGILGMHWGVRRTPEQLGRAPKTMSEMSNRELRSAIKAGKRIKKKEDKRYQLENKYKYYVSKSISEDEYNRRKAEKSIAVKYLERTAPRSADKLVDATFEIGKLYVKKKLGLQDGNNKNNKRNRK